VGVVGGDAEGLGQFRGGQAVAQVEVEDAGVALAERRGGGPHEVGARPRQRVGCGVGRGGSGVGDHGRRLGAQGHGSALVLQPVEGSVAGGPQDPAAEGGVVPQ